MRRFQISRPAVHKHLNALIKAGKVRATGTTRNRTYALVIRGDTEFDLKISQKLEETQVWNQRLEPFSHSLPPNIYRICLYGFTEMLNNVIDHSGATEAHIIANLSGDPAEIWITDNGVGVFQKIQNALNLPSTREAIFHLSKGKFTTDPAHHTGEGIFFTSRLFDEFVLSSGDIEYRRFSEDDWVMDAARAVIGTALHMKIGRASMRRMEDVFARYTDVKSGDFGFDTTDVLVKRVLLPGEFYISRSQAKRLLAGLDKFKQVILDFKQVSTVGQGFVDEVFRVFQNAHPDIRLQPVNMNPNVAFMVRRGIG